MEHVSALHRNGQTVSFMIKGVLSTQIPQKRRRKEAFPVPTARHNFLREFER